MGLSEEHLGQDLPTAFVQAMTQVDLELVTQIICLVISGMSWNSTMLISEGSLGKTLRHGSSGEFTKHSCWCMDSRFWKEKSPAQLHSSAGNSKFAVDGGLRWHIVI